MFEAIAVQFSCLSSGVVERPRAIVPLKKATQNNEAVLYHSVAMKFSVS